MAAPNSQLLRGFLPKHPKQTQTCRGDPPQASPNPRHITGGGAKQPTTTPNHRGREPLGRGGRGAGRTGINSKTKDVFGCAQCILRPQMVFSQIHGLEPWAPVRRAPVPVTEFRSSRPRPFHRGRGDDDHMHNHWEESWHLQSGYFIRKRALTRGGPDGYVGPCLA